MDTLFERWNAQGYGTIGVAVSGGMDSMCLMHYLVQSGAKVVALTVEHGIRGEDSLGDAALVEAYATSLGVRCIARSVDAPRYAEEMHMGLEQAARELRHAFFAEALDRGYANTIATAHHLDDQTESTMLNILRGTGLNGLTEGGKRPHYVRPFAGYTRSQIVAYARTYSVPYREDATNRDTAYSRNYLRWEVLPAIARKFPAYRESLARLRQMAGEQVDLLDSLAIAPSVSGDVVFLPVEALAQHPALAKWSVAKALHHFDYAIDVERKHLEAVLALADTHNNGVVCLPHGVNAAKEYDRVAFWQKEAAYMGEYPVQDGVFAFGNRRYRLRPWREGDKLMFDPDKMPEGAMVRLRRAGDVIDKFGGGSKNLGDYYTDNKVPTRLRDTVPVVAVDKQILVCAVDIARTVAVDQTTQRVFTFVEED